MIVGVNARLLRAPSLRGWNRYAVNLLAELAAAGVRLVLYSDAPVHPAHLARLGGEACTVRVSPAMRYILWEQVWLPRRCAHDRIDVLHSPFNFGLPWRSPCPRVLTLHDAIDRVYYRPRLPRSVTRSPAYLQSRFYHWIARRAADHVITVSDHARHDLERVLRIPSRKISVIYEAADAAFHRPVSAAHRADVRRRYGVARPYVFYVGGLEERKNVAFLVRAFAAARLSNVDLVLAGGDPMGQEAIRAAATAASVREAVHVLGEVDDADLPALYAEALTFVYPSAYEGFGLQLCEAMAAGCPVLAARAGSLPEILGTGGDLFSLDRPEELATLLARLGADAAVRADLIRRGTERSAKFSWKCAAERTLAVYRSLRGEQGSMVGSHGG